MNFPGRRLWPIQPLFDSARDNGIVTKRPPTGIARGGRVTEDYNVKLRGRGLRVDLKPSKPWP